MTLGEKIAKQRKELNYTQEQLADILGVSRQSISKWESDIAYPETDKLIKMGKLFDCSMDYLLNEDITEKQDINPKETETLWDKIKKQFHERKSGTGCVYQINDHLWEGSYFPRLPDGKRKKFNVYAKTREECEAELAEMIEQKKKEIAELKKKAKTA